MSSKLEPPPATGWPPSELMQDDNRGLSIWLSTRLGAKYLLPARVPHTGDPLLAPIPKLPEGDED